MGEFYTRIVEKLLSGIEVRLNTDYLQHRDELNALADKVIYTGMIVIAGNGRVDVIVKFRILIYVFPYFFV